MIFLLLILHAAFFILVLVMRLFQILLFPLPFLALALFVPFAGEIACLIMNVFCRRQREGSGHENSRLKRLADARNYLAMQRTPEPENVVPAVDALALGNAGLKREVLMQIIMQEENRMMQNTDSSRRYADVLAQAKASGDTEVVHYAATAITQIQDAIEAGMHTCDQKLADDPDNDEILGVYANLIDRGLRSSVWSGKVLEIQRSHLLQILERRYRLFYREEDGLRLAATFMDAGRYGDAWNTLQEMGIAQKSAAGLSDEAYLIRLRYAYETREEKSFQKLLTDKKAEGGYQTEAIRSVLQFFCEEEEDPA